MIGLLLSYWGWIAFFGTLSVVTELWEFVVGDENRPPPEDDG